MSNPIGTDGLPQNPVPPQETSGDGDGPTVLEIPPRKLRLWPTVAILALAGVLIAFFHLRAGDDAAMATMPLFMGPAATSIVLLVWWVLGSGLLWKTRIKGLFIAAAVFGVVFVASHTSMRMLIVMLGVPISIILSTIWAILTRKISTAAQLRGVASIACVFVVLCSLLRFDGMYGNGVFTLAFRWSPTLDDKFAEYLKTEQAADPLANQSAEPLVATASDWPEFRGLKRDGIVRGVKIRLDWKANLPQQLWKHPVDLGWSSFAVVGNYAFTQEQRREEEVVVCYDATTGRPIWIHADTTRFSEAMGGDGPRATPTFYDSKIYALGANGLLNCLDAKTGKHVWSTNVLSDGSVKNLEWGMAGSPLVFDDMVIVNPGGSKGHGLVAYNRISGKKIWSGGSDEARYSSPQLAVLNGKQQVLIFDMQGLAGHDPKTGKEFWKFTWPSKMTNNSVQPHVLNASDLLIATAMVGTIRLRVQHDSEGWTVSRQWTSRNLKLNFNDLVIKDGYAYGLDQGILTCINLADGKREWKRGRYGFGQVLLLDEDKMLLVLTEKGEVALVEATSKSFRETARFQAIQGKTWNHPVIANGKLFVRNNVEAACYDVSPGTQSVAKTHRQMR